MKLFIRNENGSKKKSAKRFPCQVCNESMTSETALENHRNTQKHKQKYAAQWEDDRVRNASVIHPEQSLGEVASVNKNDRPSGMSLLMWVFSSFLWYLVLPFSLVYSRILPNTSSELQQNAKPSLDIDQSPDQLLREMSKKSEESRRKAQVSATDLEEPSKETTNNSPTKFFCDICQTPPIYGEHNLDVHNKGSKHAKKARVLARNKLFLGQSTL